MDPRFVGRSTPIRCHWNTGTYLQSAGPNRRTFNESVALMRDLAARCAREDPDVVGSGPMGGNAPATAATLKHWAGWAAGHDPEYGLGATTADDDPRVLTHKTHRHPAGRQCARYTACVRTGLVLAIISAWTGRP
ncbi:hypothetical protein Ssi03_56710 [Sphaerisporangium siamense]|uniref:Uncharacterized protein n=1 Tax=Sphaerisporangium siamense TaxID=795645 RepID=A0A7W7D6J2_9ACTN|nr:hypothetical protein [Sphaerisporangium siamense]MBB4700265.1 hypothetical protein [Sphaerisporangium siamense]GII87681.1 hypothetical protein Ssi03_56710 [Sphaerisporangium siamense]